MSAKYTFILKSDDRQRPFPHKILLAQQANETAEHVLLRLFGYLLFFRERIQIQTNLHLDYLPFTPDLVQLDYELRPKLWVECGDCGVNKLDKLAVKVHEAEIWVMKSSRAEADRLLRAMAKEKLRTDRYGVVALDTEMFGEVASLLRERNEIYWFKGSFDPAQIQFEFNGLWFEAPFEVLRF